MAAFQALTGDKTFFVDSSFGAVSFPAATFFPSLAQLGRATFAGCAVATGNYPPVPVTIGAGSEFFGWTEIRYVDITAAGGAFFVIDKETMNLRDNTSITCSSPGSSVIATNGEGMTGTVNIFDTSRTMGVNPTMDVAALDTLTVNLFDASQLAAGSFGAGGGAAGIVQQSSAARANAPQANATFVFGDIADELGYTPAVAGDWDGDPATAAEAIDRLAAAVAGLVGGPIPLFRIWARERDRAAVALLPRLGTCAGKWRG